MAESNRQLLLRGIGFVIGLAIVITLMVIHPDSFPSRKIMAIAFGSGMLVVALVLFAPKKKSSPPR